MITISLWGLLLMEGIYDGMTEQMISNAIRYDSGHLAISGQGYRLEPHLARLVSQPQAIQHYLNSETIVQGTLQRLRQDGLVATAHGSRPAAIIGIELDQEQLLGNFTEDGQTTELSFGPARRGALLGLKLAQQLKVTAGSKLILSAQDSRGEVSSMAVRVKAIFKSSQLALEQGSVFVDLATSRELFGVDKEISQLAITVDNEKELQALQQRLQQRFPQLDIQRWDQLQPALLQSRQLMTAFNLVTTFLIFTVAALGIFAVILVSVLERRREFAIMLAMGSPFRMISMLVIGEALGLSLAGLLTGSLLGAGSLLYFKIYGLDLSMFSEALNQFGLEAITYALIRPSYFLSALAAILLACFSSVIFPLRLLHKAKPVEALNG